MNFIFDLDETIIISRHSIKKALTEAFKKNFIHYTDIPDLMIGPPLYDAIATMLPSISETDLEAVVQDFQRFYDTGLCLEFTLHPEAIRFIESCSCLDRFFIVTNKRDVPAQLIFHSHDFFNRFERRITIDAQGYFGLTKGERIVKLMNEESLLNIECVYIGDHPDDEKAARHAVIDYRKAW